MTLYATRQRRWTYATSPRHDAFRRGAELTLIVSGALLLGVAAAVLPLAAAGAAVALALAAEVWRRPAFGAYLVIGVTPLTAGIDRNTVLPLLRPNEAVVALVGCTLFTRWVIDLETIRDVRLRIDAVLGSILLLAVASSVIPLLWMALRGEVIASDDVLYALVIWKYFAVFLLVRSAIRTEQQIWYCLIISVLAAIIVALIAILQSLGVGAVISALSHYYVSNGNVDALSNSRGSSTLTLPIAVADLMVFNLAILVGLWLYVRSRVALILAGTCIVVAGTLAAAEFSGVLGLAVGVVALLVVTRSTKLAKLTLPGLIFAMLALWPVIHVRLLGFQSSSGLPVSWTSRLFNLRNYFWPVLRESNNYLLGVRPAARVPDPHKANGFIWIESGYTWLLWAGGIPLALAFGYFVVTSWRAAWTAARRGSASHRVAGTATVTALAVTTVLMAFDPHLTYRGSADALFSLLALTVIGSRAATAHNPARLPIPSARFEVSRDNV